MLSVSAEKFTHGVFSAVQFGKAAPSLCAAGNPSLPFLEGQGWGCCAHGTLGADFVPQGILSAPVEMLPPNDPQSQKEFMEISV